MKVIQIQDDYSDIKLDDLSRNEKTNQDLKTIEPSQRTHVPRVT